MFDMNSKDLNPFRGSMVRWMRKKKMRRRMNMVMHCVGPVERIMLLMSFGFAVICVRGGFMGSV